jgi:hypothetical protein
VNLRNRFLQRALLMITIVVILAVSTLFSISRFRVTYSRNLHVGDRFTYKVVFPDSNGYTSTEIAEKKLRINNTDVYVIFRDDDQHISTNYLWLTTNWYEVKSSKSHIGNLNASSTVIYEPPIELVHIPLRTGDKWEINSSVTTLTTMDNREQAVSIFRENRETVSLELVRTPIGNFQAYKITVESSNSPFETLWFSGELGQVVYAEFYNPLGEMVTETLTGFVLNANVDTLASPSAILPGLPNSTAILAGNSSEVICTTNPAVSVELKIPYDGKRNKKEFKDTDCWRCNNRPDRCGGSRILLHSDPVGNDKPNH